MRLGVSSQQHSSLAPHHSHLCTCLFLLAMWGHPEGCLFTLQLGQGQAAETATMAPYLCTCTFWRCAGMLEAAHRAIACLLATAGPCWGAPPAQVTNHSV